MKRFVKKKTRISFDEKTSFDFSSQKKQKWSQNTPSLLRLLRLLQLRRPQ